MSWQSICSQDIKCLLLVVALAMRLSAQEVPVPTKPASGRILDERDKNKEDQVAKLFETIRVDAKIPPLERIGHRDSLEEEVCTAALAGTTPKYFRTNTSVFYKSTDPGSVSPELNRIASFNQLHSKDNPNIARFSVAVSHMTDAQTGQATYSVGVRLYWSVGMEFLDGHFTDDIFYRNEWKKRVAPECRGK
jgi:hypothetical protein